MIDDFKEQNGNYPPRSELHKQVQKKTKMKLKYPVISLLAVFFFLLPILVWSIISYFDKSSFSPVNTNDSTGFEVINYDNDGSLEELEETHQPVEEDNREETIDEDEAEVEESIDDEESNVKDEQSAPTLEKESVEQNQTKTDEPSNSSTSKSKPIEEKEYKEIITHTVGPKETLFRISIKYYKSRTGEEIIRSYNNLSGNEIYEGQVLKIPIEES